MLIDIYYIIKNILKTPYHNWKIVIFQLWYGHFIQLILIYHCNKTIFGGYL